MLSRDNYHLNLCDPEVSEAIAAAERRGFERAKELCAQMVLDDGYAITFQSMARYRRHLSENLYNLKYEEGS